MATLPDLFIDPTLEAVDKAIVDRESTNLVRPYLGASAIGKPCSRELWYSFRWSAPVSFDALTHKRFQDGHRDEDLMAYRLRMVPQIELWTIDTRTGHQIGISDHGGHFKGHLDGVIKGILQAPKTITVWEHKTANEKKQAKLDVLKEKHGEKDALKSWDEVYYAQAIVYMHYMGLTRHYLTCSSPGGRTQTSCRTNTNATDAKAIIEKAKNVITSSVPLDKISEKPGFYLCGWCDFQQVCNGSTMPSINCRTCAHSTPELDGDGRWSCALYKQDVTQELQRTGCTRHVYLPSLLTFKQIDANELENWIEYEKVDGTRFKNGDHYFSSEEIRVGDHSALGDPGVEALKKPSGPDWLVSS